MKLHSLTQGQVAVRAGLSQPVISDLVRGATGDPPISTLIKISLGLQLELDQLLGEISPEDVDETESLSDRRMADLEKKLADVNDRLTLVLEHMPALVAPQRPLDKPVQP